MSQCKLEVWVRGSLPSHTPPELWLAGLCEVILGVASLCACVNGGISGCTCTVKELVFLADVLWLCSLGLDIPLHSVQGYHDVATSS